MGSKVVIAPKVVVKQNGAVLYSSDQKEELQVLATEVASSDGKSTHYIVRCETRKVFEPFIVTPTGEDPFKDLADKIAQQVATKFQGTIQVELKPIRKKIVSSQLKK